MGQQNAFTPTDTTNDVINPPMIQADTQSHAPGVIQQAANVVSPTTALYHSVFGANAPNTGAPTGNDANAGDASMGGGWRPTQPQSTAPPVTVTATDPRQTPDTSGPGDPGGVAGPGAPRFSGASGTAPTSYTAPGIVTNAAAGLPAGSGAPTGMSTEQSNAYYGPINAAMGAKTAQDQQQSREAGIAQGNSSVASVNTSQAEEAMRRANTPRMIRDAQANLRAVRGDQAAANDKFATASGGRNFVQEAQARQDLTQKAQGNQLDLAKGAQGLQSGTQEQQLRAQQIRQGEVQAHIQQHMTALQQTALGTGPEAKEAQDSLALYQKAQQGKGGPLTEEDKLKVYGDMVSRATAMGGPDAYKTLPNYNEFSGSLHGGAPTQQHPQEGQVYTDAKGNKAKYTNGAYVPQ
jgi:hypothetical protein